MVALGRTGERIIKLLGDGEPRKSNDIIRELGLTSPSGWGALKRCWIVGVIMRSEKPVVERRERFRGRRGSTQNTRNYYLLTPLN